VKDYVRGEEVRGREMFVPLTHAPGEAQADFGESLVVIAGVEQKAHFDDDFVLYVDGAKFAATTHQSGSTRTRIVLAFHAALMEVSLVRGGNHPGWLLFDASKHHELSQTNFDAYAERLQLIAARYPGRIQVVSRRPT
jgi:hypothetical protein